MSITKTKKGPGRPKGSKNKIQKNKSTSSVKRGRGRPKGAKNKVVEQVAITCELPFPNPIHESQRIENIRYMTSFYQHPDGKPKSMVNKPKKRGRKAKLETFDPEQLLKEDLDSDKITYTEKDIADELGRMDAYRDLTINKDRY
jgi:hypothetical protein